MSTTETEGSRVIVTEERRVELVEPWKAGERDPSMQDWLKLPAGDHCPADESHHWGTWNPRGYFLLRHCSDCGTAFRPEVTPIMIREVVGALTGNVKRFALS